MGAGVSAAVAEHGEERIERFYDDNRAALADTVRRYGAAYLAPRSASGKTGLVNQGATCYMNSLLQALFMTPEFRALVYGWRYDSQRHGSRENCIPVQLQHLFCELELSAAAAVCTTRLTTSFGWTGAEAFQQHDVQELCRVLLDALERSGGLPADALEGGARKESCDDPCADAASSLAAPSALDRLFRGTMDDYVKCCECGFERRRGDAFNDISLAISQPATGEGESGAAGSAGAREPLSVMTCLRQFVRAERLEGDNRWHCDRCGTKVDALKGLSLTRLPPLLMVHLKRFVFDWQTMRRVKLNDEVVIDRVLDLASLLPTQEQAGSGRNACEYELSAVLVHSGTAAGGHYFAYVRDAISDERATNDAGSSTDNGAQEDGGGWFEFNDSNVTRLGADALQRVLGRPQGERDHADAGKQGNAQTDTAADSPANAARSAATSTNAYLLLYRRRSAHEPPSSGTTSFGGRPPRPVAPPDVAAAVAAANQDIVKMRQVQEVERHLHHFRVVRAADSHVRSISCLSTATLQRLIRIAVAAFRAEGTSDVKVENSAATANAGTGAAGNTCEDHVRVFEYRLRRFEEAGSRPGETYGGRERLSVAELGLGRVGSAAAAIVGSGSAAATLLLEARCDAAGDDAFEEWDGAELSLRVIAWPPPTVPDTPGNALKSACAALNGGVPATLVSIPSKLGAIGVDADVVAAAESAQQNLASVAVLRDAIQRLIARSNDTSDGSGPGLARGGVTERDICDARLILVRAEAGSSSNVSTADVVRHRTTPLVLGSLDLRTCCLDATAVALPGEASAQVAIEDLSESNVRLVEHYGVQSGDTIVIEAVHSSDGADGAQAIASPKHVASLSDFIAKYEAEQYRISVQCNKPERALLLSDQDNVAGTVSEFVWTASNNTPAGTSGNDLEWCYTVDADKRWSLARFKREALALMSAASVAAGGGALDAARYHCRRNPKAPPLGVEEEAKTLDELGIVAGSALFVKGGEPRREGEYFVKVSLYDVDVGRAPAEVAADAGPSSTVNNATSIPSPPPASPAAPSPPPLPPRSRVRTTGRPAKSTPFAPLFQLKVDGGLRVSALKLMLATRLARSTKPRAVAVLKRVLGAGNDDDGNSTPHIRVREKKGSEAGKVLRDDLSLQKAVTRLTDRTELAIQVIDAAETFSADDMLVGVRLWRVVDRVVEEAVELVVSKRSTWQQLCQRLEQRFGGETGDGSGETAGDAAIDSTTIDIAKSPSFGAPLDVRSAAKLKWNDAAVSVAGTVAAHPCSLRDGSILVVRQRADRARAIRLAKERKAAAAAAQTSPGDDSAKGSLSGNRKGSVGRRLCRKPLRDMPAGGRDRDGSIGISWGSGGSAPAVGRQRHREVGIKIRVHDPAESEDSTQS